MCINMKRSQHCISSDTSQKGDYEAVYNTIAQKLKSENDYDVGSYGLILLRLGWHCSGTYDAATGTGGSNGATMWSVPESKYGPNTGMENASNFLESIKQQNSWISYSDLWTLAAVCAVQQMGGPDILWRPGREDRTARFCAPDGRLPLGGRDQNHLRMIFGRMGSDDRDIMALSGAHAVGPCHATRSGIDGSWKSSPTIFWNEYFKLLLSEEWHERTWYGPRQFEDGTKRFMMLPTDYCLIQDVAMRQYVEIYAADQDVFFDDFSKAMTRLFELGVPFAWMRTQG